MRTEWDVVTLLEDYILDSEDAEYAYVRRKEDLQQGTLRREGAKYFDFKEARL